MNQDRGTGPDRPKGAAVHVMAMREAFARLGAEIVAVDGPDDERACVALEGAHADGGIDLVYERYALGCGVASHFARLHGLPHVLEVNAPLEREDRLYRGGGGQRTTLESDVLEHATRVLAVSREVARYAIEAGARADHVRVTPNAVDAERFRPRAAGDELRAALVPEDRFAVGFHGRLRPWHGFDLIARAFALLLERGLPVHLVLLGEGDFAAALDGRVPTERVTSIAWVPHEEAGRVVACFDALPLAYAADRPCYYSPLKLFEAMAAGVVPIVPALGELPETIGHGRRGLVVAPGSAQALADALERLLRDDELRRALASAAHAWAGKRTWVGLAREILEDVLSTGGGV